MNDIIKTKASGQGASAFVNNIINYFINNGIRSTTLHE